MKNGGKLSDKIELIKKGTTLQLNTRNDEKKYGTLGQCLLGGFWIIVASFTKV